jgi:hypothetical protein
MVVFGLFFVGFACISIFYVRVFNKWNKAEIVAITRAEKQQIQLITYVVGGIEYTSEFSTLRSNGTSIHFDVGDYIEYQVSNPNYVMSNRTLPLVLFSAAEILIGGIIVTLTVLEFKRRANA